MERKLVCLQIHNDYQIPGGETTTAKNIADLLERNNVGVIRYYKTNDSFASSGVMGKVKVGIYSLYNPDTVKEINHIIKKQHIDFALLHNYMPIVSNSVFKVLLDNDIPIIKYVQNYNLICLNGGLDHGTKCYRCRKCNLIGIKEKCYKGSTVYSAIKYVSKKMFDLCYARRIKLYLPNSYFVKRKLHRFGVDIKKMRVMHNYIDTFETVEIDKVGEYFLYYGRLSKEKGIQTIIETFKRLPSRQLVIAGKGELEEEVSRAAEICSNISYKGFIKGEELNSTIKEAKCVIVPSEWDEPLPRTVMEAYSYGIPVIGADCGGITEMIEDKITGSLFKAGNKRSLKISLDWIDSLNKDEYFKIRENCIRKITNEYSERRYIDRFMDYLRKYVVI